MSSPYPAPGIFGKSEGLDADVLSAAEEVPELHQDEGGEEDDHTRQHDGGLDKAQEAGA